MFGYWKRRALSAEAQRDMISLDRNASVRARDSLRNQLSTAKQERDAARFDLIAARNSIGAESLLLAAERQDNERLRAKLKTAQAGLDHATRCYEQCEADCQASGRKNAELTAALASAARAYTTATRDLERIHLISSEHVTEGTFATLEPTEAASVQPEPADELEAQPGPHDPTWFGWGVSPAAEAKPAPRALGGFASITCVCDELGDSCLNPTNCSRAPRVVCPDTCPSPIAFGGSASITVAAADDPLYPDGP
jgi:multidrug efflux pump subunit AcrA (membrane-fusion protein)